MVFVVLRGLFLLALLTLEVVNHRLDGDHCPRQDYDAEASDQDVAEKDEIITVLSIVLRSFP